MAKNMAEQRVRRLPSRAAKRLVGILSVGDIALGRKESSHEA
jgi:hypothetical protein